MFDLELVKLIKDDDALWPGGQHLRQPVEWIPVTGCVQRLQDSAGGRQFPVPSPRVKIHRLDIPFFEPMENGLLQEHGLAHTCRR